MDHAGGRLALRESRRTLPVCERGDSVRSELRGAIRKAGTAREGTGTGKKASVEAEVRSCRAAAMGYGLLRIGVCRLFQRRAVARRLFGEGFGRGTAAESRLRHAPDTGDHRPRSKARSRAQR